MSDLDVGPDAATAEANNSSVSGAGVREANVSDASVKLGNADADDADAGTIDDVGSGRGGVSPNTSSPVPRLLWDSMGLSMAMGVPDLSPTDNSPPTSLKRHRMQMQSSPLDQYLMVRISHFHLADLGSQIMALPSSYLPLVFLCVFLFIGYAHQTFVWHCVVIVDVMNGLVVVMICMFILFFEYILA